MFKKILVAFDGTDEAYAAFLYSLELAEKFNAELIVLSVVLIPQPAVDAEVKDALERGKERFDKYFTHFNQKAKQRGVMLKTEISAGHPSDQIVMWAEKHHVDLILLGHWPKSSLGKWLLGTVSSRVVDHARCSVLVVKEKRVKIPEL